MYEILMEPIQTTGSVDNLLDIANVASLLFEWAEVTGYPTMPFNEYVEPNNCMKNNYSIDLQGRKCILEVLPTYNIYIFR